MTEKKIVEQRLAQAEQFVIDATRLASRQQELLVQLSPRSDESEEAKTLLGQFEELLARRPLSETRC